MSHPNLTAEEKQALLKLARTAIEAKLIENAAIERPTNESEALKEKRGCFVTLHKKGALRGCIGTIEAVIPLVSCVEENAFNAAFRDPRFSRLTRDELPDIHIEISVLTVPQPLEYDSSEDLLNKLKPGVHGVILARGSNRSTFLPQVWDQLPDKRIFLEHLCQKGGMSQDCWKDGKTKVLVYEVEYFS